MPQAILLSELPRKIVFTIKLSRTVHDTLSARSPAGKKPIVLCLIWCFLNFISSLSDTFLAFSSPTLQQKNKNSKITSH